MNEKMKVLVLLAATQFVFVSTAYADPTCLIGKWQVEEEIVNVNSSMPQLAGAWSVSGGLLIEIFPSADSPRYLTVRLLYDDYVVRRTTRKGDFDVLLEIRYRGEAEGSLTPYNGGTGISLKSMGDVTRSLKQKFGDRDWMDAGEEDETPPHEQDAYAFACEGDELTLSKTELGPFGGDYNGRFARVD